MFVKIKITYNLILITVKHIRDLYIQKQFEMLSYDNSACIRCNQVIKIKNNFTVL